MLAVNLTGALLGIQALVPLMGAGASIVNVSSVAGLTGYHGVGYAVSKWGVRGLSRGASLELGPRGIRVNTIRPGFIETPMTASAPEAFRSANIADDAARPHRHRRRGGAARRVPDLGRVVVRQRRRDPRRRRPDRATAAASPDRTPSDAAAADNAGGRMTTVETVRGPVDARPARHRR